MPTQQQSKSYKIYLRGQWVATQREIEVINPATEQAFARVSTVDAQQVQEALCAAERASTTWRRITAKERGTFLQRVADEVKRRQDEIARLASARMP